MLDKVPFLRLTLRIDKVPFLRLRVNMQKDAWSSACCA